MTFKVTTLRIPENVSRELNELARRLKKDKSDVLRDALQFGLGELKLRLVLELYSKGKISFGRMTELSGLGYRELFLELKRRGVEVRYGEDRFAGEVEELLG